MENEKIELVDIDDRCIRVYTVYHYHIYQWQVETRSIRKEQPGIFCHQCSKLSRRRGRTQTGTREEETKFVFEQIITKSVIRPWLTKILKQKSNVRVSVI